MKKFLVPALLLGLVGVAAALAAGSAPSFPSADDCHKSLMGASDSCPMTSNGTSNECNEVKNGGECAAGTAEPCAEPAEKADCRTKCEDKQEVEPCTKKLECCPKPVAPAEKP